LRAPGSFWIALASGTGAVYHGYEAVDSNTKVPNTDTTVHVRSGFSPATIFQLEPEVGYQVSKRFSVSAMGRYQVAPKDSSGYMPGTGEHAILTSAFAGFARAQFAFINKGGFQAYASGGAGLGTSVLAIVSKHCGTTSCPLDHGDTLHGGPVALTAGAGAIYHLDPRFGIFVEIKEIATLPKVMALTSVSVGLAYAHKFQHSNDQKSARSTSHVSWR
jgi:opacity protein-like surface antigen